MFDFKSTSGRKAAGWPAYYQWNQAIADAVYSSATAGLPVYLDLEEETLERVAREVGADGDPHQELTAATRATLELEGGRTSVFRRHQNLLGSWRRGSPREVPPTLALLALLSLAAEAMRGGEGMSANNYYGRLCELLEVSDQSLKDKIQRDYRKCAEELWGSLNDWLLAWEGERGLPTAEALGHRHIGLPISQALVRAGDRRRLRDFFTATGLPPGGAVTPADMERLLGTWIDHEPSPVSNALRALWKRYEDVRERVATLACLELSAWSGAAAAETGTVGHVPLRLLALLRRIPSIRLELSLALQLPATERPAEVTFTRPSTGPGSNADAADVTFEALGEGWLQLGDPELFEAESLVAGTVRLNAQVPPLVAERRPRRVVPLRQDESVQLFVEADRVHLGEDTLLLCREAVANRVASLLEAIARPGFRRQPGAAVGLAGWVLFTDVQVLVAPDPEVAEGEPDLSVLLPATGSQVLVTGGLQMPGRARKWSSLVPPEVRVVIPPGAPAQVLVTADTPSDEQPRQVAEATADGGALVLALQDRRLPDGDYLVEARKPGVKQPLMQTRVRLRSADTPVPPVPGAQPLVYPLGEAAGLGPLSAVADAGRARFAAGARVHGADLGPAQSAGQPLPVGPSWLEATQMRPKVEAAEDVRKLPLGTVDPASCVITGSHRFELPDYRRIGPSLRPHSGRCSGCGLVKWFGHSRDGRHKAGPGKARTTARPGTWAVSPGALRRIVPVRRLQEVPWDAGLDALCHLNSGSASELERVALQLQGERLFVHQFVQVLEALGHLDIERDPRSLRLRRWQVPPSVLAGLPSGECILAGWRSRKLVAAVASCVAAEGGRVEQHGDAGGPSVIKVSGLTAAQAVRVAGRAQAPDGHGLQFQPDAAVSLADALPPLRGLLDMLPRVSLPSAQSVERWDTVRARWAPARLVDRPGGYKLRGPLVRYGLCTEQDLAHGTFALGSSQVVKHLAALLAGTMHLAYDERSSCLLVPFGADLPGLYGRAAVLCSGCAPTPTSGQPLLLYHHVPPNVARTIAHALTDQSQRSEDGRNAAERLPGDR
jgi:hypothetical protein